MGDAVQTDEPGARECLVILPAFREAGRIAATIQALRARGLPVLVVDDGSPDATATEARAAGAEVVVHTVNQGKGAALQTGFAWALARDYQAVITMDADGQHDPADIEAFLVRFRQGGAPVIIGSRMDDPVGMPLVRRLTNRFMSWLLSRMMGQRVSDTQSGYRLYARSVLGLLRSDSPRFAAESEVLLRLAHAGVPMGSVPIRTIYGDERSKINPFKDTWRFLKMLRRYRRAGPGETR